MKTQKNHLKKDETPHYFMNKLQARQLGVFLIFSGLIFGFIAPVIFINNQQFNISLFGIFALFIGIFLVFTNS